CWRRCAGVIFFAIRFLTFAYKGRACRMAWFTTAGNAPSPDAYAVMAIYCLAVVLMDRLSD
ncbi:hypothetical protein, partial [Escherichia coli]|uniref:hypothetical protein n=1 Tax=Escherichia coli TaxID=562 RepID=UPI001BB01CCA